MSIICPTVLASEPHAYREQLERVAPLASRLQIDFMDGDFASPPSIGLAQAWWSEETVADIHLMYRHPLEYIETLVSLHPSMVIVHAEAKGDLKGMMEHLQGLGIKAGVALLQDTSVESAKSLIEIADHVLIFAGNLGHFGGHADMKQLDKVAEIRTIKSEIEIGWDGGANETNAMQLSEGGIDVLNVGSAIQRAVNPLESFQYLKSIIS